jgi:hypothetical protein
MHPYFWHFFHEQFQPVVEVFQDARGSGEIATGPGVTNFIKSTEDHWINTALQQGKKLGFIAGGDHMGLALAGVLVDDLTRTALYEALTQRRCFATTGVAATVQFRCNGAPMGAVVPCDQATFEVVVEATSAIDTLQIIRDGAVNQLVACDGSRVSHTWSATRQRSGEYWYIRVLLEDGEIVWSSPVWLVAD